ncbi:MAG: class I SAM-dependent methyltransferase [Okeania sp. SIO3B3]|nr:class I SAM-dependent methyltransferase [Okeania sp. SIO3B3]
MRVDSISVEQNKRFWESNQSEYFGARHAKNIYFLCKNFLSMNILDAGAGDGAMVRALRQLKADANIQGIDLAPKSDDVAQGDLTNLPFEDNHFDSVLFMEVIEHLTRKDIKLILDEIARVLKPGGSLILTTPYAEILEHSLVCCPKCDHTFHRYGHQHSFLEEDIHEHFQSSGLQTVEIFPVKMNKINRFKFLGPKIFRSAIMKNMARKAGGKRNIIGVAQKP